MAKYLVNANLLFDVPSVNHYDTISSASDSIKILMDNFLGIKVDSNTTLLGYSENNIRVMLMGGEEDKS